MRTQNWYRHLELGDAPRSVDVVLRLGGLGLLAGSAAAVKLLYLLEKSTSAAGLTPGDAVVAFAAIVLLSAGLMLVFEGAQLFRLQPMPPRSWLPQARRRK